LPPTSIETGDNLRLKEAGLILATYFIVRGTNRSGKSRKHERLDRRSNQNQVSGALSLAVSSTKRESTTCSQIGTVKLAGPPSSKRLASELSYPSAAKSSCIRVQVGPKVVATFGVALRIVRPIPLIVVARFSKWLGASVRPTDVGKTSVDPTDALRRQPAGKVKIVKMAFQISAFAAAASQRKSCSTLQTSVRYAKWPSPFGGGGSFGKSRVAVYIFVPRSPGTPVADRVS
jgi:hypothetical protein